MLPRLPLYVVANDNWIGREKLEVRKASQATHWLLSHVSMAEYRKRVLFKYEEHGPQAVTPSEKRNMVQNFAHFQQYSHPERRREAQGRGFIHGHCWLRREYGQLGAPATPPGPPPSQPAAPTAEVHRYNN